MKNLIIPEFSEGNTVILNTFFFFLLYNKAIAKIMKQFNLKKKFLKTNYKYNFRDMY